MTLEQALYEMELVGHDFYLFVDKESEQPSVVYRRRGYDYGVISLDLDADRGHAADGDPGGPAAMTRRDPSVSRTGASCHDAPCRLRTAGAPTSRSGSSSSTTRSCSGAA